MVDKERVLNLLDRCLELKKYGVDAFLEYIAHINKVGIRVFPEGWEEGSSTEAIYIPLSRDPHDGADDEITVDKAEKLLDELLEEVRDDKNN